jgi:hypothetical protein
MRIASFSARNLCKSFARNCFADLFRPYNQREEFRFGRDVLSEDLLCEPCFLNVLFATYSACKHLFDWRYNQVQDCYWRWFSLLSSVAFMLWDNHWLAMPGEVTEWWNFQSMMASNTIGYIRYVVKRNVFKHSFFEAYSFRTHTFPHHLSVKVWAWIAKMVVWCSEPKEAQRSTACSQHQKQETKMKFAAGGTLCGNMQNRCNFCLPSVQDNVTLRTNCKCLTPECIVITPECNEMALLIN